MWLWEASLDLFKLFFFNYASLGELKWLGIFVCTYNRRSEVVVLFSISEDLDGTGGEEYPMDIWLLLASYIRPEDIVNFPWFVRMPGLSLALLPFGQGCTEGATTEETHYCYLCGWFHCFWFDATPWTIWPLHFL